MEPNCGIQQEDNYKEFLTWITDGGLRYAFAKKNNLANPEKLYRTTVPEDKSKHVIVVGAGMTGLTAAYELAQIGHKVTILEGQARVGGKVKTFREGFSDDLHCEGGAMRLPQRHFLTKHYVDLFKLKTAPFKNANENTFIHMYGEKVRKAEWVSKCKEYCDKWWPGWDAHLPEGHDIKGITDLFERTIAPVVAELTPDSTEQQWQDWIQKWSCLTMDKFLRSDCYQDDQLVHLRPWPEAAIKAYQESSYTPVLDRDVPWTLRKNAGKWLDEHMYTIVDGMDKLPKSFLATNDNGWNKNVELRNNIVHGVVVEKVEVIEGTGQHSRVRVVGENKVTGKACVYEADGVILAVSLPILRQLNLPLAIEKQNALADTRDWAATRLLLQCRHRFWEAMIGKGGFTKTILQIGQIHYPFLANLNKAEQERGILMVYAWAKDAHLFGMKEQDLAIRKAIEQISQIHPEMAGEFEVGQVQAWHNDPFAQCAIASLNNVDFIQRMETLTTPTRDIPIYLAGEFLSWSNSWMQGAIFSGLTQAYCFQCTVENGSICSPVSMMK